MNIALIQYPDLQPESLQTLLQKPLRGGRLDIFEELKPFRNAVEGGFDYDLLVIAKSSLSAEEVREVQDVLSNQPYLPVIFVTEFAEAASNRSRHPLRFVAPANVDEVFPELLMNLNTGRMLENEEVLILHWNKMFYSVLFRDIAYVERNSRVTWIYTDSQTLKSSLTLDELEAQLPASFARNHNSYIVNMNDIRKLSRTEIELRSGTRIPVSRSYYQPLKEKYQNFLEERKKSLPEAGMNAGVQDF